MKNILLPSHYQYIVIEGNIGAGKTSLANILATKFNAHAVMESFAENTFLPQFYENPERFAFPLEMSFLAERYQQLKSEQDHAKKNKELLVGDYLFEKSLLFAQVNLQGAELELFTRFYHLINPTLKTPDVILYLHRSTEALLKNIAHRGRTYEKSIKGDYLEKLSQRYLAHLLSIENQNIILIESDSLDFVHNSEDLLFILDHLSGHTPKGLLHVRYEK
jgi:deoxyadenosine/deoxycytidine kinase